MNTKLNSAVAAVVALGQAIRELKSVPSGHLYAQVMGRIDLDTYNACISVLVKQGLVRAENNMLTWIGK